MRAIDADNLEKSLENSCDSKVAAYYFTEFLNYVDEQETLDCVVFPQTIGDITFYSSKELFWWVLRKQKKNYIEKYTYEMDLDG